MALLLQKVFEISACTAVRGRTRGFFFGRRLWPLQFVAAPLSCDRGVQADGVAAFGLPGFGPVPLAWSGGTAHSFILMHCRQCFFQILKSTSFKAKRSDQACSAFSMLHVCEWQRFARVQCGCIQHFLVSAAHTYMHNCPAQCGCRRRMQTNSTASTLLRLQTAPPPQEPRKC